MNKIFAVSFKDIKLYEIFNDKGEPLGILATTLNSKKFKEVIKTWSDMCRKFKKEKNMKNLIVYLNSKGYPAIKTFFEETIRLP